MNASWSLDSLPKRRGKEFSTRYFQRPQSCPHEHSTHAITDTMGEVLGKICIDISWRSIVSAIFWAVEKPIVQRRGVIIRQGCRIQKALRIPECLTAFTEGDPGMLDSDIRCAATFLVIAQLLSGLALLIELSQGRPRSWVAIWCIFGVAVPLCTLSVTWLGLVLSKKARLSRLSDTEKGAANADIS